MARGTTSQQPGWMFREYQPVGVELGTRDAVATYDQRQGTDPAVDNALLDRLAVEQGTVLVDLACGTGSFAVQAAGRGGEVHGVDVKQEALRRAATMLRPGGTFYLWDAIFSFGPADAAHELQRWVDAARETESFTPEQFETHIREEFSTYSWILAGMLERVGLEIVEHTVVSPTHAEFVCRRVP